MRSKKKHWMLLQICLLFLWMVLPVTTFGATEYSEGYFHYEIEEESISITEYFGEENEVTVPSVIAGYPVSKIAKGAFVETSVTTLHLPDTIMTIEEQAIAGNINVVYTDPIEDASKENTDTTGNIENPKGETESAVVDDAVDTAGAEQDADDAVDTAGTEQDADDAVDTTGTVQDADVDVTDDIENQEPSRGIQAANQVIISVDQDKHLISTDSDNKVTVLDDTQEYTQEEQEDGTVIITDSKGQEVTLDEKGAVIVPTHQKSIRSEFPIMLLAVVAFLAAVAGVWINCKKKK